MNDNIYILVDYFIKNEYEGRKNYYNIKIEGDLANQYNLMIWDDKSSDPKPTLIALQNISNAAYLEAKRTICIKKMKAYAKLKEEEQLIEYLSVKYKADLLSQNYIVKAAANGEKSRDWFDSSADKHLLDKSDLATMLGLCNDANDIFRKNKEFHKTQINQSNDPDSYDFTTGWPLSPFTV